MLLSLGILLYSGVYYVSSSITITESLSAYRAQMIMIEKPSQLAGFLMFAIVLVNRSRLRVTEAIRLRD
jgi:hypothetical protein